MTKQLNLILVLLLASSIFLNVHFYSQLHLPPRPATTVPATLDISQSTLAQHELNGTKNQPPANPDNLQSLEDSTADQMLQKANQLFRSFDFAEALVVFDELSIIDETMAMELKRSWHAQVKIWLTNKTFANVEAFTEAFLQRFPYDLLFLDIKAEKLIATGQITDAIELLYSLISYSFEQSQDDYWQSRIHLLAEQQFEQYKKSRLWLAALDFSRLLLTQEPQYPPYLLAQAEAHINIEQLTDAENILMDVININYYRDQAQHLLDQIHDKQLQYTAIKLRPLGEHYIVEGLINQSIEISLMIDTGASVSVLTQQRFESIQHWANPLYLGQTLLNTAGGQVTAPIYQFDRFQIGEFVANQITFVVLDMEDVTHHHGLLGMNFLKQFKFQIDQEKKLLILSP